MDEILRMIKNFFFNLPALFKSFFWKRDNSIILMDSWFGNKFADNSRYLFQYLSDNKEVLGLTHVVWITRNFQINEELNRMGYESYMIDSSESKFFHKYAKYHIVNNSPNNNDGFLGELLEGYSYGAIRINLWHGIAGKGVKFANTSKTVKYSNNKAYNLYLKLNDLKWFRLLFDQKCGWGNAYYLVQSTEGKRVLKSYFRLPDENYILTGYPRICKCPRLLKNEEEIVNKINRFKTKVLYLPTFRTSISYNFKEISENLIDILEKEDIIWIQKAHSADKQNDLNHSKAYNNIINLDSNFDINVLLPLVDVLITDYSSCMIEGIALRKKMIFYVPDFKEYLANDRGISYDPQITMCGPKIYNIEDLRNQICNLDIIRTDTDEYNKAFELYWSETYSKSLKDIWNDIIMKTKKDNH